MPDIVVVSLLKPLLMFGLAIAVLYPARVAVQRYMKDGKPKRLLMTRIN